MWILWFLSQSRNFTRFFVMSKPPKLWPLTPDIHQELIYDRPFLYNLNRAMLKLFFRKDKKKCRGNRPLLLLAKCTSSQAGFFSSSSRGVSSTLRNWRTAWAKRKIGSEVGEILSSFLEWFFNCCVCVAKFPHQHKREGIEWNVWCINENKLLEVVKL